MSDVPQINVSVVDGLPEAPQDSVTYGRRNAVWVDMTAPANLQVNRGNAAEVAAYTPLDGEPVWDSESKLLYVGDGQTQGGIAVGKPVAVGLPGEDFSGSRRIFETTYFTDPAVTLTVASSVWHIVGRLTFEDVDLASEQIELNLAGSAGSAIRGLAFVFEHTGNKFYDAEQGVVTLAQLDRNELSEQFAYVSLDYIVAVPSNVSSIDWGIPVRSTGNDEAGFAVDDPSAVRFSRLYARRLV
jgi:hypothetical protein